MSQPTDISLSKSRLLAGLQCPLRLWLEVNHPELADPLDDAEVAILDQGQKIGAFARELYPGGVLIEYEGRTHDDAMRDTQAALADPNIPVIYEAALRSGPDNVRVDILVRAEDGQFDLVEVKSASEIGAKELNDVSYQLHLTQSTGLKIRRVFLVHPNRAYRRGTGPIDPKEFFLCEDVTEEARARAAFLATEQSNLRAIAIQPQRPTVDIGPHCSKPVKCEFIGTCHRNIGDDHIENIPHISDKLRSRLRAAGITSMHDIPDHWELFGQQRRWVEMVKRKTFIFNTDGFVADLSGLRFPIHFFDFEGVNAIIPLWPGRKAYETVPFQFSNHTIEESGQVRHSDYLHVDFDDPEDHVFEHMRRALGEEGSIVIYSQYEVQRWRDMARRRPEWESYFRDLEARAVDLLPIIRRNYAHPALRGRYSLKAIYKQLLPGLSYDDLAIRNGAQAAAAYKEILDPATPPERRAELAADLRAYCARDTEALLRLLLRIHPSLAQKVKWRHTLPRRSHVKR